MRYTTMSGGTVAAGMLTVAAALAVFAPVAVARHINGERLCEKKFDKPFKHWTSDPILGRRGQAGRLSYNYRFGFIGRHIWLCAVTIRRHHRHARLTGVRIKSVGAGGWRRDASRRYRLFAGPVVRGLWSHGVNPPPPSRKRLRGRGTIGKGYTMFSLRYLHDSDDLPVILRLRARFCAPDGFAHGRDTHWLNLPHGRAMSTTDDGGEAAHASRERCPSV